VPSCAGLAVVVVVVAAAAAVVVVVVVVVFAVVVVRFNQNPNATTDVRKFSKL
jgi:hypothetical protein